jgi:hypothetical protein
MQRTLRRTTVEIRIFLLECQNPRHFLPNDIIVCCAGGIFCVFAVPSSKLHPTASAFATTNFLGDIKKQVDNLLRTVCVSNGRELVYGLPPPFLFGWHKVRTVLLLQRHGVISILNCRFWQRRLEMNISVSQSVSLPDTIAASRRFATRLGSN